MAANVVANPLAEFEVPMTGHLAAGEREEKRIKEERGKGHEGMAWEG